MSNEELRRAIKKEQAILEQQKERIKLLETIKSLRKENKHTKNPKRQALEENLKKAAKKVGKEIQYYGTNVRDNINKQYGPKGKQKYRKEWELV